MQNRQKLLRNLLFLLIVAVQIAVCVHYAKYKTNLFMDEIWTFNLANSYYNPFLGSAAEYMNRWIDSKFWLQALSVQPGEEFCYGSVFYNQAQDVHPPLYYMVIHTVCSLFPQKFSIWFGIIPNIVFFVATQFILLKISDKLFDSKWIALLASVIYGFSWGAINSVIYIRMYMMLTFFGILSFWVHLLLFEYYNKYKKLKINYLAAIFIITICGFLTQYYYLIFAFFLSGIFGLWLLKDKEIKLFMKYSASVICGIIASIVIFPAFIQQVLYSQQGLIAMNNLHKTEWLKNITAFIKIIDADIFGNLLVFVAVLLFICCIYKLISFFIKFNLMCSNKQCFFKMELIKKQGIYIYIFTLEDIIFLGIITIILADILVVSKIAPFLQNRYIYILYPLISLIVLQCYKLCLKCIFKKLKYIILTILMLAMISCVSKYDSSNVKFSYVWKNTAKIEEMIYNIKQDINGVLICENNNWWPEISQLLIFSKTNKTMLVEEKNIEFLINQLNGYGKSHDAIIIYLGQNIKNHNDLLRKISAKTPFKYAKEIDSISGKTYFINK